MSSSKFLAFPAHLLRPAFFHFYSRYNTLFNFKLIRSQLCQMRCKFGSVRIVVLLQWHPAWAKSKHLFSSGNDSSLLPVDCIITGFWIVLSIFTHTASKHIYLSKTGVVSWAIWLLFASNGLHTKASMYMRIKAKEDTQMETFMCVHDPF